MRRVSSSIIAWMRAACPALLVLVLAGGVWTSIEAVRGPAPPTVARTEAIPPPSAAEAGSLGRFLPTSDYFDRLNSEEFWRNKRSGSSSGGASKTFAPPPPSGVTRVPAVVRGPTTKPPSPDASASPGKSQKSEAADSQDEDNETGDDESPWTKEGSRGTYRTLCVRMCDGYFFPISFSTSKGNLARDAKVCERSCSSPAKLFYHENPGQDPEEMEDLRGKPYKELKVAFLYRKQYDAACTCKPQPWDEAALARHRKFAEAAEAAERRKNGGKKIADGQKVSDAAIVTRHGGPARTAQTADAVSGRPDLTLATFTPAKGTEITDKPSPVIAAIRTPPGTASKTTETADPPLMPQVSVMNTVSGPVRLFRSVISATSGELRHGIPAASAVRYPARTRRLLWQSTIENVGKPFLVRRGTMQSWATTRPVSEPARGALGAMPADERRPTAPQGRDKVTAAQSTRATIGDPIWNDSETAEKKLAGAESRLR